MKINTHFLSRLAHFFLESEILRTKFVEKIKTHFMASNISFFENRAVYEIMWRNLVETAQATDDNMAHAHCMLDT